MTITHKQLSNGLSVIVEEMSHVESASFDLVIPGGIVFDSDSSVGASLVFTELLAKGAGSMDSRQLSEAFENEGIRHGESIGMDRFHISGSMVAPKLARALELVSSMVLNPRLPEEDIEPIQSILLQDIAAIKDNPARRSMVELTKRFYPGPFNRSSLGEERGIKGVTRASMVALHERFFRPHGAILSVAGNVNTNEVLSVVEELFKGWEGKGPETPKFGERPPLDYYHIEDDSAQMQIVMASPSVKFSEPLYYAGKVAVSLLGASMFGRLFVELREKRGLCYSVYARHGASDVYGTTTAYVGTTPERAQESLDLLVGEFQRLSGTVTDEELERAKTNLKASLIMGEESPGARASSNGTDWWLLKRIRSLEEIHGEIDAVSKATIEAFIAQYPFQPCSLLTLGKGPLKVNAQLIGKGA